MNIRTIDHPRATYEDTLPRPGLDAPNDPRTPVLSLYAGDASSAFATAPGLVYFVSEPLTQMLIPTRDVIITALDEVYRGPAWHGPAVLEALDGVDAATAARDSFATRNSIWDLVLHLAHGRHLLIERINDAFETFPREIREPWWPAATRDLSETAWRNDLVLLEDYHQKLVGAVRAASDAALTRQPSPGDQPIGQQLLGMAMHDAYHAGQIRLLVLAARAR